MTEKVNIREKDILKMSTGEYVIRNVLSDGNLALENRTTGKSAFLTREGFLAAYSRREISISRHGHLTANDFTAWGKLRRVPEAPDANYDARARIRQLMLEEYDANPVGLSVVALKGLIAGVKLSQDLEKAAWRPSAGTLRRDIKSRGCAERRPLRLMVRRTAVVPPRRMPDRMVRLLDNAVVWFYRERHRSIGDAYDRLKVLSSYLDKRSHRRRGSLSTEKCPSYETVRKHIRNSECYAFWKEKFGETAARRRFSGIAKTDFAERPLDVVMLDATVVDAILVIDDDGKNILGRPTLMAAIDVCTRMIMGVFITFEPPSIYAVMNCLKAVLTPKEHLVREKYPDIDGAFVAYGKPFKLIVDNGLENVGSSFQDMVKDLGINVEWAPVKTPEFKRNIERFFGTLNSAVFHKLKGGIPGGPSEMRKLEIDPAKEACISLSKLDEIIHQFIVEVYQVSWHRGIDAAPLDKWQKLTAKNGIDIIEDLSAIDEACGYVKDATLTRRGIQAEGLTFHEQSVTSQLLSDLLPISARGRGRKPRDTVKVKIKFDPSDISQIRVWNVETRQYAVLPNIQQKYAAGTTLWYHRFLKKEARRQHEEFISEDDRAKAKYRLVRTIESAGRSTSKRLGALKSHNAAFIEEHKAVPRHDGNAPSVPVNAGLQSRADDGMRPPSFQRGRAKSEATRRAKKKATSDALKRASADLADRSNALRAFDVPNIEKFLQKLDGKKWGTDIE